MQSNLFEISNVSIDNSIKLESSVALDEITNRISNAFDYVFDGKITTEINVPDFPKTFNIGLIVGSSGSGKSTLLKKFGSIENIEWQNDKCIASHFSSFDEASSKFGAVGLNSIPTWLKPYSVLSTGEKFRADMSRLLHSDSVIDEFTSVVNRECAISCSYSIAKYIRQNNLSNVVFASCHDDIISYLEPDWVYDTDKKELFVGRLLRRTKNIILEVHQSTPQIWSMFSKHHYLSAELNTSADCYIVTWNKIPIAFGAILSMPGRFGNDTRKCVSEHRIVVLPDYQGMGIGNKFSEYLGELYTFQGYRYFGKTANPRMGEHRQRSDLWKATSTNLKNRAGNKQINSIEDLTESQLRAIRPRGRNTNLKSVFNTMTRLCYSHEYIGNSNIDFVKIKSNAIQNNLF